VTAAPAGSAITTQGLTRRYGPVLALDRLDLEVPAGSVFGLLGPNGAGKTTAIRILTGLARPTSGTATVAGAAIDAPNGQLQRRIGYLDQDPRFYGWMRGRELLEFAGRLHGLHGPGLRSRVAEVLETVGLTDAAKRKIGGYSGGMRQRLGIGQAMIGRPEVLDIVGRLRDSATVFISTHILADVERVCDRVAILDFGHLVIESPIDDLLETYARPIYTIEPEPGQPGAIERLAAAVRDQAWTREVRVEPGRVRVFVNDPRVAGPALLPLLAATGVTLVAFERARPSLEEVFLHLVAADGRDRAPGASTRPAEPSAAVPPGPSGRGPSGCGPATAPDHDAGRPGMMR